MALETHEGTRQERKERTRQAILASALALSAETGLAGLSLRQVAKDVGIVPTAFYRHFDSIDALGLVLVDDAFVTLRSVLRALRREPTLAGVIPGSVRVLSERVHDQEAHFRFIARERAGGTPVVRTEIKRQLGLFERELAADLARLPDIEDWPGDDLRILSELIVSLMVSTAENLLDAAPEAEAEVARVAEIQLRMLVVGAAGWRPGG